MLRRGPALRLNLCMAILCSWECVLYCYSNITGHQVTIENFNIVGRADQNLSRAIKEALYIRVNNPSLNKNIGKFQLPHIWDEVLFNTSELKLK